MTNGTELLCRQLEPPIVNAAGKVSSRESDAAYGDGNGRRNGDELERDRVTSRKRYSRSHWRTARSCVFGSSNYRPLTRRTKHLHFTRLTRLDFNSGPYNTWDAVYVCSVTARATSVKIGTPQGYVMGPLFFVLLVRPVLCF